jgi:protein-disulfide isomerase
MGSSRRNKSSVGLLLALGGGALVAIGLIIALTTTGGGGDESTINYQRYTRTIDTTYGAGAPGFAIGEPTAPVTVVDYSDFSCAACARLEPALEQIINEYVAAGQVRVIFKPMTFIGQPSVEAGKAAYCAAEQGYFWEMKDDLWTLFSSRGSNGYRLPILTTSAEEIDGLNVTEWRSCYDAPATLQALQAVDTEARQLNVTSTPTVFVNGQRVEFRNDLSSELLAAVEAALN